jgi:hypothetical protein
MNDAQDQHSIKTFLGSDVEIRPYESFIPALRQLATTLGANKEKVSRLMHVQKSILIFIHFSPCYWVTKLV